MTITIIRPNQHVYTLPGYGQRIIEADAGVAAVNDWWTVAGKTCVAAYQPKGAASLAASYINLANPGTNNAAPGTAPDWDSTNGWKFNGSDDYLTTGLGPRATWSVLLQFSNMSSNNSTYRDMLGYWNGGSDCFILEAVSAGGTTSMFWNMGYKTTTSVLTSGNMAMAAYHCYVNGSHYDDFRQSGTGTWTECLSGECPIAEASATLQHTIYRH